MPPAAVGGVALAEVKRCAAVIPGRRARSGSKRSGAFRACAAAPAAACAPPLRFGSPPCTAAGDHGKAGAAAAAAAPPPPAFGAAAQPAQAACPRPFQFSTFSGPVKGIQSAKRP